MIYAYTLSDPSGIHLVATFRHKRRATERVSEEAQAKMVGESYYMQKRLNRAKRAENEIPASLYPSLLAVNKQIHAEARDVLYGNEFTFADTQALYSFLINLGPAMSKHLKSIRLLGWGWGRALKAYNHACFAVLVYATNLEQLYLDTSNGYYSNPTACATQLYRDAFPWLEAVGQAKGRPDAAVDIIDLDPENFSRHWRGTISQDEHMKYFWETLSKLMGTQQGRILAKPVKRKTVSKKD
jgi:hypothetical protein